MEIVSIFLFFIGLLGLGFIWSFKKDKFWEISQKVFEHLLRKP